MYPSPSSCTLERHRVNSKWRCIWLWSKAQIWLPSLSASSPTIPDPHSPSSGIVSSGSESLCRIVRRQLCGRGSSASGLGRSPILVWPLNATEVHLCSPIVIAPEWYWMSDVEDANETQLCECASVCAEVWKVFSCWLIVDFKLGIPNRIASNGSKSNCDCTVLAMIWLLHFSRYSFCSVVVPLLKIDNCASILCFKQN